MWIVEGVHVRCLCCGHLAHASPSQLEDWRACRRKWKYRRLRHDFPVPQNVWAGFGDRCHKIREGYLRDAIWTEEIALSKEGACVAAGISLWPRPGSGQVWGVEIEIERMDLLGDGIPWTFKIDDIAAPSWEYDLGDLKTIGDLRRAKTELELVEDAQRVCYSVWAGPVLRRRQIRSRWTYCERTGKGAKPVDVETEVHEDRQRLAVINVEAREMILANTRGLDEQDRNLSECFRYKGFPCSFVSHCHADLDPLISVAPEPARLYTQIRMTTPPTLGDALVAVANGSSIPPMPGAAAPVPAPPAKPLVVLTPELETWVQQCVAAGHPEATIRAQAEAAMVQRAAPAQTAPAQAASSVTGGTSTPPETTPPRRGRPKTKMTRDERFDLIKHCALGGLGVDVCAAYLELAGGSEEA